MGRLATEYAQQAKAIPRTNQDWQPVADLLYRGNEPGTLTVGGYPYSTTNYVSCNAVQGARAFSAEDLK